MIPERLLTAVELSEVLRLKPGTVLDKFERGELPGFKLGGAVRFRWSEIEAWLEQSGPELAWRPQAVR
ncbi:MAG: helix-turn-helix domain-containing protein [Gaiellaceae bacterium]